MKKLLLLLFVGIFLLSFMGATSNLALGKTYIKSVQPNATYPDTSNLEFTDGLIARANNGSAYTDPKWFGFQGINVVSNITIDLGATYLITNITIRSFADAPDVIYIPEVNFFGSTDNATFTLIVKNVTFNETNTGPKPTHATYNTSIPNYRYIRFEVKTTSNGYAFITEGEIFGEDATTNININLTSPLNNSIVSTSTQIFNTSLSMSGILTDWEWINATNYIWFSNGTLFKVGSNISLSTNNTNSIINISNLIPENYKWNTYACYGNATFNNCSFGSYGNSTFNISAYSINSETYNTETTETLTEQFTLNISLFPGVSLNSAYLVYNSTSYSPSISSSGNIRYLSKSITIPSTDISYNATFYWILNLSSGTQNTTAHNQTINTLKIDDCSINSILILNYTIFDEDTRTFLNSSLWNTSSKFYIRLSGDVTGNEYEYYSGTKTNNSLRICVNSSIPTNQSYLLSAEIQYTASDHVTEYYYIENYYINVSSAPLNISLYSLAVNNSQEFLVTYKDSNLIPVEDALIVITRQYLNLAGFLTIEISKTDQDGRTIGHFVLNDEVYTIYVIKDGVLLATFENVRAFCSDIVTGDCRINLYEASSSTNPSSFTNYLGVIGSQSYDDLTKTYTFQFTTEDSTTKTIDLSLYSFGAYENTLIYNTALVSSSGTISYTIPEAYYNNSVLVKIYVDGELYNSYIFDVSISKASSGVNSPARYILAFFLIVTIPLIAFSSGVFTLILFIVGLVLAGGLTLVDWGGYTGIFSAFLWFIISAIILISKASKRRQQY